jgi:hypothetical protein
MWEKINEMIGRDQIVLDENGLLSVQPGSSVEFGVLRSKYSRRVIPDPALIAWLVERIEGPAIEIEAGNGYMSHVLRHAGVRAVAYSSKPEPMQWGPVVKTDPRHVYMSSWGGASLIAFAPPNLAAVALAIRSMRPYREFGRDGLLTAETWGDCLLVVRNLRQPQLALALAQGGWNIAPHGTMRPISLDDEVYVAYHLVNRPRAFLHEPTQLLVPIPRTE